MDDPERVESKLDASKRVGRVAIEVLGYVVLAVTLTAATYAVARYGGDWFR